MESASESLDASLAPLGDSGMLPAMQPQPRCGASSAALRTPSDESSFGFSLQARGLDPNLASGTRSGPTRQGAQLHDPSTHLTTSVGGLLPEGPLLQIHPDRCGDWETDAQSS